MVFLRKGKETISHQKVIFLRKSCPDVAVFTFHSKMKVMTPYLNPRGKEQNYFRRHSILKLVKNKKKTLRSIKAEILRLCNVENA